MSTGEQGPQRADEHGPDEHGPGQQKPESGAGERVIFFSDAVVAIAITLLAIDLPVPAGRTMSVFLSSVSSNAGHYLAFLLSFAVIAAAWIHHHDVFRSPTRFDSRLRTLNMAWLLMIVITPFATRLLTARHHDALGPHAVRFGFYALVQVLISALLLAMVRYIVTQGLQAPGAAPLVISDANWKSGGLILGFGLSIPVFFVTAEAWLLWIVIPPLFGRLRRLYQQEHAKPEASGRHT